MFEKEWLPYALSIGISYKDFWHMNPRRIRAFGEAHKKKTQILDEYMWQMGWYNKEAFQVVMAHFGAGLSGKKSDAEYIKKPLLQENPNGKGTELTEEEKQREVDLFFKRENIRRLNWQRNKRLQEQESAKYKQE